MDKKDSLSRDLWAILEKHNPNFINTEYQNSSFGTTLSMIVTEIQYLFNQENISYINHLLSAATKLGSAIAGKKTEEEIDRCLLDLNNARKYFENYFSPGDIDLFPFVLPLSSTTKKRLEKFIEKHKSAEEAIAFILEKLQG